MKSKSSIFHAALLAIGLLAAGTPAFAQDAGSLGLRTVVIDPGHGGKDSGAVSKDRKTQEKKLTLEISAPQQAWPLSSPQVSWPLASSLQACLRQQAWPQPRAWPRRV